MYGPELHGLMMQVKKIFDPSISLIPVLKPPAKKKLKP
jgi:hypothetical protein